MARKLLVTGAAGFIGSNFVHYLVANTDDIVTVLDKFTYAGNPASLAGLPEDRVNVIHGDICEADVVDRLVSQADVVGQCEVQRRLADVRRLGHGDLEVEARAVGVGDGDDGGTIEIAQRGGDVVVWVEHDQVWRTHRIILTR